MNFKKLLFLFLFILVIFVVLFFGVFRKQSAPKGNSEQAFINTGSNTSGTIEMSLNASTTPIKVTGGPLASEKIPALLYEIKIINGKFVPEKITVERKENIQISVVATDGLYDVLFPAPIEKYLLIKKGQAAVFGLKADTIQAGTYRFSCRDKCPTNGTKMEGTLVIK